jgi:hypothetical protein
MSEEAKNVFTQSIEVSYNEDEGAGVKVKGDQPVLFKLHLYLQKELGNSVKLLSIQQDGNDSVYPVAEFWLEDQGKDDVKRHLERFFDENKMGYCLGHNVKHEDGWMWEMRYDLKNLSVFRKELWLKRLFGIYE